RIDRTTGLVPYLEAVVFGWIVAGRNVDSGDCAMGGHAKANHRRGRRPIGEEDVETVARQHLGHGSGKVLTHKALVMADHDAPATQSFVVEPVGKPLCTTAHVLKRVIIGDTS